MNTWIGRAVEWSRVVSALDLLEHGRGGVVLVEGEPGDGRSHLLREAAARARARSVAVGTACADELTRWCPLAPLAMAAGAQPWTMADPDDTPMRVSARLLAELTRRVRSGPMVIALDDLQWADPLTLAALQSFTAHLRERPVLWLLARRDGAGEAAAERLFDRLTEAGATRLRLSPLPPGTVDELVGEVLGAPAGQELAALVAGAAGNLGLLVDLLHGLRDERAVQVDGGRARPTGDRLPRRLTEAVRRRLAGFSADTVGVLEVAAVMGPDCRAADLADVLGRTPADVLRSVRDALRARLLAGADDPAAGDPAADGVLRFRHDLVRRAVAQTVAPSVRVALDRQIGLLLLRRGDSRTAAVDHLLRGAVPGDLQAVRALGGAARRALDSTPGTAARIAATALSLTVPGQVERAELLVTRATALVRAGRLRTAAEVIGEALAHRPAGGCTAGLHIASAALLVWTGRRADAVAELDGLPAGPTGAAGAAGPSSEARAVLTAVRLAALAGTGRDRAVAEAVLAAGPGRPGADPATACAHLRLADHRWADGDLEAGLEHLRRAAACPVGTMIDVPGPPAGVVLAARLAQLGDLDLAERTLTDTARQIDHCGHVPAALTARAVRAWIAVQRGHLDEAGTEARDVLATGARLGVTVLRAAHAVLAVAALHGDDVPAAQQHVADGDRLDDAGVDLVGWAVVRRLVLSAGRPADEVADELVAEHAGSPRVVSALVAHPAGAVWLVRTATEAGNPELSRVAVRAATELAGRGAAPGAPVAAHAIGLVERDPAALRVAAHDHGLPWARAAAAEDLATVLLGRGGADAEAVGSLEAALAGFQEAGAVRDAARVRGRLRAVGIRRRHWTYADRPVSGWASLTDTERDVAGLVAEGLTNRQVAARMFVSPHTVHAHLGRIFRKLGVNSRVELTGVRHRVA